MSETIRWMIKVSKETDLSIRTFLGSQGMEKGGMSKFVEEAVQLSLLSRITGALKERNQGQPEGALEALIENETRAVRATPNPIGRHQCPFCNLPPLRIVAENELAVVVKDGFPVSPGHMLIIPRRHVASFFQITEAERASMLRLLDEAKASLDTEFGSDAYNIGINDGSAAGQTVAHLHIHLIPRYAGDSPDPRGGVRWVLPNKAKYWP